MGEAEKGNGVRFQKLSSRGIGIAGMKIDSVLLELLRRENRYLLGDRKWPSTGII